MSQSVAALTVSNCNATIMPIHKAAGQTKSIISPKISESVQCDLMLHIYWCSFKIQYNRNYELNTY